MSTFKDLPPDLRAAMAAADFATAVGALEAVRACDVEPTPIRWLWPGRVALGKLTLIAGDPGLGKSVLLVTLAAHVTRGRAWPVDGSPCPMGSALLISAEDDVADTIRPRLDAADADPARVNCAAGIVRDGVRRRGLALDEHIPSLAATIERMADCRLVGIDPVSAFLGSTDSHSNAEVRGVLAQLAEMAQRLGVAVVMVSHLNKSNAQGRALYRASGSLAFVAASRAAFAVAPDKDDPKRRLFLPTKNNLSSDDRYGLAYRVVSGAGGGACLAWEPEPVTITADEALSSAPAEPKPRDEAADWLRERLAKGPVAAKAMWEEAKAAGFARATVNRAKRELGVVARKIDGQLKGGWMWHLPGAPGAAEGDHLPTDGDVIPFVFSGASDPLRSGSLAEEDHDKALEEGDPLPPPRSVRVVEV